MITFSHNGIFLKQKKIKLCLHYHTSIYVTTLISLAVPLKNVDISHMLYSNETLFSDKHISFMTELGYEAKSHKLPQGKSLVLKSCEFIRSSWLIEDETFHGHFMAQIC